MTLPDHDSMVLNVLAFYARATPAERRAGFAWYGEAREHAERLSVRYGVTDAVAAAVIAALSPQTEWTHNVRWAEQVVAAWRLGLPLPRRGLGNNLLRASRALSGDLSDITRAAGTLKVRNFYGSIIGERGAVCVDRHALRIVAGDALADVPALTDKRYGMAADAYRAAARELRKSASGVQAVTWLVCRRERGLTAV